jgi:ribosomal protein S18 acetylase RimI-like enzyme
LHKIIIDAKYSGKSVTLQVLKSNPKAKALYERLGFKVIEDAGYHFKMKIPK